MIKRTILEETIQSDIEERKVLLLRTKTIYLRYGFNENDEAFFLKYSIPIIYSVWEGFIQTTFQTYISEINEQKLSIEQLCKPILVFHTESKFKQFKQYPDKITQKISFFEKLIEFYKKDIIEISPVVNTESNVGFNVLNRIMTEFHLEGIPEYPEPGSGYSLKNELDGFLLKIRNGVAHGNNAHVVNRDDLKRAIDLVERLMDLVFDRVKKGFLDDKSYKNKEP
jgi:antitoxin component HigA of HigAB toxin-antitoxin module